MQRSLRHATLWDDNPWSPWRRSQRPPSRITRFDGLSVWARLDDHVKARIGTYALEHIVALTATQRYEDAFPEARTEDSDGLPLGERPPIPRIDEARWRAMEAALEPTLDALVDEVVHEIDMPDLDFRGVPVTLGPICQTCGCSTYDPCFTGCAPCGWVDTTDGLEPDLCTACAAAAAQDEGEATP
jgi:hypothetical protein